MNVEQRTLPSDETVGCDMEKKVIGAEKEIDGEQTVVIRNAEQNCQESGCEFESIVIDFKVNETTWKYIQQMPMYTDAVKKVQSETQVIIVNSGVGLSKVEIRGSSHAALTKIKVEMENIFKVCKQEVQTVVLPKLDPETYSRVISFLEETDIHSRCVLTLELQRVSLTGKTRDIDQLLGLLEETFGVTGAMPVSSDAEENSYPGNEQLNEIQNVADDNLMGSASKDTLEYELSIKLKLLDGSLSQDEVDHELYGADEQEFIELEDDALTVDENIWCYMDKHPDYSESLKLIKDKSNFSVMLEPVKSSSSEELKANRVRVVFTGSDEAEVRASVHKTKSIIKHCQEAETKTLRVPCPERAVHQKITKLLKAINRLPSYVSVESEIIAITGNRGEIENCLEKLQSYGLIYEISSAQKDSSSDVLVDNGERMPDQEAVGNMYSGSMYQEPNGNRASSEHFEHRRQLPVPIEEFLWLYIDRQRKQELNDLRKDCNLQIIADGADVPDFVSITLASNSIDMLDCGQDAVVSLIEHMRQQIVLGVLDTASPEDLPQELQGMLQQQCHDMESIIILKGSKICIIGPNQEAMKCQQLVAAFMQNVVSDARNRGYDTSGMTSMGHSEDQETAGYTSAGDNLHQGYYYGEGRNGTVDIASFQKEQPEYGDGEPMYTKDDTCQTLSATVAETSNTGNDHKVRAEVVMRDTSAVGQMKAEGSSGEKSTVDVLHLHHDCRLNGTSEKISSNNSNSCSNLEKDMKAGDCSVCHDVCDSNSNQRDACHHHYCLSCVHLYFGERECPVCGTVELSSEQMISQPDNGLMLTTYDNSFRLPGYENSSRGTIVVTYAFPPGIQLNELPNPGRAYPGLTTTTFFPMCLEGSKIVDLLQRAFEKRLLFKISQNQDNTNGNLVWNGILHKVNIFGGPQQYGYPDPIYLRRISNDLEARGIRDTA